MTRRQRIGTVLRGRGGRAAAMSLGLALALGALVILLQIRAAPKIAILDELPHLDYMVKASSGHIPRVGDYAGQTALREDACRGTELPGAVLPPCNKANLLPEDFPTQAKGLSTAAPHPPVYYLLTGVIARAVQALLPIHSIVTAGRLVGLLWLAVAIALTWLLMAEFGSGLVVRTAAIALMIVSPLTLDADGRITNDATAVVSGAAVLLAVMLWERGRAACWLPLLLSGFAAATKATNVVAVVLATLYLLIRAARRETPSGVAQRRPRELLRAAAAILATAILVSVAWLVVVKLRTPPGLPPNPIDVRFHVDHLSLGQVIAQIGPGFSPFQPDAMQEPVYGHVAILAVAQMTNWLAIGACLTGVFSTRRATRVEALALATTVVLILFSPLFVIVTFVVTHTYFPVPDRYTLAAVPAILVLIGTAAAKRGVLVGIGGFSAVAVAVTVSRLLMG